MIIYLVGMPGVGKSFWAKKLRKYYNCESTDLDLFIEIKTQLRIAELFKIGESHFRTIETSALKQISENVSDQKLHIIATGGGAPCFNDNMDYMLKNGIVVYLKASPEFINSRLQQSNIVRPLIQNVATINRVNYVRELLSKREFFYNQSHLVLDALSLRMPTFVHQLEQIKII